MSQSAHRFDANKFINSHQAGGIDAYTLDEGPARGVRALCVNTGGGLRYRVLLDRGLDIDQAFFNQYSLSFLTYKGVTPPTRGLDHGLDWLKSFPGGLLTSCGPFNIGPPDQDQDEDLGLHGPHSNTAATIESVLQPDPHLGRDQMSITGTIRYGAFYGPCVQLRRTIRSTLGGNTIEMSDEFTNAGNQPVPHAWLLHINFGYPLVDAGAELCFDSPRVEPTSAPESVARFRQSVDYKRIPEPQKTHRGPSSAVAYLFPKATDRAGNATVGIVNRKLALGVAIHYNTRQFPRCGNWQHFGPREYVTALEPMNGTIEGRSKDRQNKLLDQIPPGGQKVYRYSLEVIAERARIDELRRLNEPAKVEG
ncbi:MAG TPA: DUF4432 family protein [Tepidisphaeraceae bacterium]|nr:DUF4432 family protein [Tepidisphaeraceae bacterium]